MNKTKQNILSKIGFFLIIILAVFLRFYKISSFPPSPYWEEVALGYDAYSILETGRDHHGNAWPIVAFESFGDWKPSGYFYVLVPFIKTFGLDVWVVRLPSVIAGILLVVVVGKLAKLFYLSKTTKYFSQKSFLLLASFVVAISPWAIQFSRAGWEVNLATFFMTTAVLLGLGLIKELDDCKNSDLVSSFYQLFKLIPVVLLLIIAAYTYHSARIVAPLLGVGLTWLWFQIQLEQNKTKYSITKIIILIKKRWQIILMTGLVSGILFSPIIFAFTQNKINQRFAETSIFSDLSVIEESNALKNLAGNTLVSKVFYHRYVLFGREIIGNFIDHFNFEFLFVSGDSNPRHSTGWTGQLYHIEALFLLFGVFWLLKNWNKYYGFLIFWLVVGILPASLTKTTPHALRILPVMPAFLVIVSLGIVEFIHESTNWVSSLSKKLRRNRSNIMMILVATTILAYLVELAFFWRFYSKVYPKLYGQEWQYGYQQMIKKVANLEEKFPNLPVYIAREQGRPAMYYWFYMQTPPDSVQAWDLQAKQDQGEYLEFENKKFVNGVEEIIQKPAIVAGSIDVLTELSDSGKLSQLKNDSKIESLDGKIIWWVGVLE